MKKQNRQYQRDDTIEKIEQIIEGIEPGTTASLGNIFARVGMARMDGEAKSATIMLLKKYGVKYTL